VCEKVVRADLPPGVKLVATQSEDVDLSDQTELIWSIFTRFDPARDICFRHAELRGAWPVYEGPVGIDATFKEGYPDPLVMPEEVVRKVSSRWGEYFRGF
jgi:4-hydroxy-3-polyprenylbenzoate decarboxylase